MFKKRVSKVKPRQRQRPAPKDSGSSSDEQIELHRLERKIKNNPNKQTNKKVYAAGSDDDADYRKMINLKYSSTMNKDSAIDREKMATGGENPDAGPEVDIRDLTKRNDEIKKGLQDGSLDDNVYRGLDGYRSYHKIRSEAHTKESLSVKGPVRGNNFFRASVRIDHEPCICKDYKETGFCGFGDSCKFIHDRGDYKMGWQIEREFDQGTYDQTEEENWEVSSDDEEIPFKCIICRMHFKKPIVTKCAHYFCEDCALAHYKTSKRCFVCNKQTNGIFNMAKNVIAKIKKIDIKEVKIGDWETRMVDQDSDANSDSDDDTNKKPPKTEEEIVEEQKKLVELEELQEAEKLKQIQYEKDLKSGTVIAPKTRNPMEDPATSEESEHSDDEAVEPRDVLKNYVKDDLTNNLGKKQKEKTIKNEVGDAEAPFKAAWSASSGDSSSDGEINDPMLYEPDLMDSYAQHTNPEAVANSINAAQNAMVKQQELRKQRAIQSQKEHEEFVIEEKKNKVLEYLAKQESVKTEPDIEPDVKIEPPPVPIPYHELVKTEIAESENVPLLEPTRSNVPSVINDKVNVLAPSAGPDYVPKPKPRKHGANNPLVKNLQNQARQDVPDKQKTKKKGGNVPMRSFLPNMNPYEHRMKDKNPGENSENNAKRPLDTQKEIKIEEKEIKRPKIENNDEWADLPTDLMNIKSVNNKGVDWKKASKKKS